MISVKDISFSYGNYKVLNNISFETEPGECVGILGNNGAGKSTLITCLNKIRVPAAGSVLIGERDVLKMGRLETARSVSYVAQKNELHRTTVFDAVLLGRKPYIKWSVAQDDIDMCDKMLERIGMSDYKLRMIDELSGGELQKVMLARSLVQQPELLLLDEPTSNLDPKNQHEMLALVREIAVENQISVLIVIHDLNLALRYCDKFLFLKDGAVYSYCSAEDVSTELIADVYGIQTVIAEVAGQRVVVAN